MPHYLLDSAQLLLLRQEAPGLVLRLRLAGATGLLWRMGQSLKTQGVLGQTYLSLAGPILSPQEPWAPAICCFHLFLPQVLPGALLLSLPWSQGLALAAHPPPAPFLQGPGSHSWPLAAACQQQRCRRCRPTQAGLSQGRPGGPGWPSRHWGEREQVKENLVLCRL